MQGTGNFPFFRAVLDTLEARYKIDRNRVYMTGFSQGGFISFAAACFFSDLFAAVAPVSGHSMTACTLKRPFPVFLTFGANEDKAYFVKDTDVWLKLNKCPSTPPTITRPYPASNPNSKATRVSYGPCEGGTSVLMDSISQQGHQWPGYQPGPGRRGMGVLQAVFPWRLHGRASAIARPGLRPHLRFLCVGAGQP